MIHDQIVALAAALVLILLRLTTRSDEFGRGVFSLTAYLLILLVALSVVVPT